MRIAITGAGGFLGRNILELLKNKDCEVYAFSSREVELGEKYKGIKQYHFLNVKEEIPDNIDVLLNCAFPRNEDGEEMAIGLKYIHNIFAQCAQKEVSALVNISSQSVYSQKRDYCADESSELNLESKYAVGKYATELFLNAGCSNVYHTNIRMASLIGYDFEQRIVNKFVNIALADKKINVLAGKQSYGYMDVRDAADAIVTVCMDYKNAAQWDEVYNLGIQGTYSLKDIAAEVQKQVGEELHCEIELNVEEHDAYLNSALNSELFYRTFDWQPQYALADTVKEIIQYVKGKRGTNKSI